MERRDFLNGALATAALGFGAWRPLAAHAGEKGDAPSLAAAAANCVTKGDECVQHCIEMLAKGEASMAECARSVREMTIYCHALSEAAVRGSKRLKAMAQIALEACQECEAACKKHLEHSVCKSCRDACVECARLCKAAIA